MTIDIVREDGIAEGATAWPIFQGVKLMPPGQDLSVLTIQARATREVSLDDAARSAVNELQRIIDSVAKERQLIVMLFVAHGSMQPNSPISLRRGLWASLRIQYGLPDFSRTFESLIHRSDSGHRKAGVAALCREELHTAAPGLRRLRSAALLLVDHDCEPDSLPLERLFELAFGGNEPDSVIRWGLFVPGCLGLSLLPVRVVGEFDDREVTVDIFASRDVVRALAEEAAGS